MKYLSECAYACCLDNCLYVSKISKEYSEYFYVKKLIKNRICNGKSG